MFQDSSTKVFSKGPFSGLEISQLRSGNWTEFFNYVPADDNTLQAMVPIGFKLRDFKMRSVIASNILQYDSI